MKLFSVVVKLVVPASDFNVNETGAMDDCISAILTENLSRKGIIKDWGYIKNPNGTMPEPIVLPIDSESYSEGDAFREENIPMKDGNPDVMDFIQRWLPEEERQRIFNYQELVRIDKGVMITNVKDGKYEDDAFRLWKEDFEEDESVLQFQLTKALSALMRLSIENYIANTQQAERPSQPEDLVTSQRREDMLVGAIEGGSNYWYWLTDKAVEIINRYRPNRKTDPLSTGMWKAIEAGETIPVHDREEINPDDEDATAPIGHINLETIRKGERIMLTKEAQHFADLINENDDASTADVWFQLAVMGEVTYG